MTDKKEGTIEAWESGQLGEDEAFVIPVSLAEDNSIQAIVDEVAELQPISIRLQKPLIEDLKVIAGVHGIGYQPLMKQVLKRFVDSEMKRLVRKFQSERMEAQKLAEEVSAAEADKMVSNGN